MQQQYRAEEYDEKLNQMKEQMRIVEEEKGRAFNELKEMKKVAEEANVMVDQVLATKRNISEPPPISNTRDQMVIQENNESQKGLELQLPEKDVVLNNLKKEMDSFKSSEANAMAMLSDYKRKVQELEAELDKRKESEANLFDTLVMQTKQLEQSKMCLEESKLEIGNLEEKLKALQNMKNHDESKTIIEDDISSMEIEKGMKNDAEITQRKLSNGTQEGGEDLAVGAKALLEELNLLKNELKSATVAEENSKKAMDDLAFALKEVATEANQVKAQLTLSQLELEHTKGDAERWRAMLSSTEERYKELLDVTKKEAERFKNTAERLRMEAEESLVAWSGKETEFVNCIRRAEEDRLNTQKETATVVDMLREAEKKIKVSKDENQKLRDIMKQALNEANVAKEAAEIAKAENARLQDSLTLLVQENEMLKIHEAASFENIKELKRLLSESSMKEFKHEDNEKFSTTKDGSSKEDKESGKKAKVHHHNNSADKEHRDSKNPSKTFSQNIKEMISPHKDNHKQQQQHKAVNEESNGKEIEVDTLRGSIFDEVDSSDSESQHDVEIGIADDFDHSDESHFDESDSDRNSRKRRALLRRFGDLIRRRGNHYHHRKDSSNEEHLQQVTNIAQVSK
ncbi:hypothetical protein RIF29_08590 [Crotalaria pallida]|uniref:Uncharacterized protein n=1 Tax=Crotalaria pallida TaxID=3830 RepID=A0AAN9FX96_CROPI